MLWLNKVTACRPVKYRFPAQAAPIHVGVEQVLSESKLNYIEISIYISTNLFNFRIFEICI